jgi:SET domain-containing protein
VLSGTKRRGSEILLSACPDHDRRRVPMVVRLKDPKAEMSSCDLSVETQRTPMDDTRLLTIGLEV